MKELMIHVEKAVRPLRLSPFQKLKTRQELLSHLQGAYNEEFARLRDHHAAVQAAIERFGPAEEISEKLSAALPWHAYPLSVLLRGTSRDPTRPDTLLESTLWGWRLGVVFMLIVGAPWYAMLAWSGRLQFSEAVITWTLLTLYGLVLLWSLLGLIRVAQGDLRQPTTMRRVLLMIIAAWCALMTLPVSFWSAPWFGPTIRDAWFQHDMKLIAFAAAALIIVLVAVGISKTKGFARILRSDRKLGDQMRAWDQLDLDAY